MFQMIMGFILAIIVPLGLLLASMLLSMRSYMDREKSSPFECGFDPKSNARIPFSLRFFLLAVLFLVFDIEIALLMPLPCLTDLGNYLELMIGTGFFLILLFLGLLHEWREGSLNWKN